MIAYRLRLGIACRLARVLRVRCFTGAGGHELPAKVLGNRVEMEHNQAVRGGKVT
jgi:hypothetical protein